MLKHRLGRSYSHPPDVKAMYMEHYINNDWDEGKEHDTTEFLELEEEIYKKMFPHNVDRMEGEDKGEELLETDERLSEGEKGEEIEGECNDNDGITDDMMIRDVEKHVLNENDDELDIKQKEEI